jgi:hypothetical protein
LVAIADLFVGRISYPPRVVTTEEADKNPPYDACLKHKSFLLLFFKKEDLSFLTNQPVGR